MSRGLTVVHGCVCVWAIQVCLVLLLLWGCSKHEIKEGEREKNKRERETSVIVSFAAFENFQGQRITDYPEDSWKKGNGSASYLHE